MRVYITRTRYYSVHWLWYTGYTDSRVYFITPCLVIKIAETARNTNTIMYAKPAQQFLGGTITISMDTQLSQGKCICCNLLPVQYINESSKENFLPSLYPFRHILWTVNTNVSYSASEISNIPEINKNCNQIYIYIKLLEPQMDFWKFRAYLCIIYV